MTGAEGQGFRLGRWDGSLEGVVDFSREETETAGAPTSRFESTQTQEVLRLRNSGAYVYHPGLFTLSVGGTFGLSQEWFEGTGTAEGTREGTLWGYDVSADILSALPFSLSVFANRSQSVLSRELAGRTDTLVENRGATLSAKRLYVPSTVSFRQELRDDESRIGGTLTRRKDERLVLAYEGRRGWTDADMHLRYVFDDFSNEIFPELSFQSHEGVLDYGADFGTELDWHWDSRFRAFARTGGALGGLTTLTVDEALRVDHTERFQTQYRYHFAYTDTRGGSSAGHTGTFDLTHRLYESLTTGFGLDGSFQTLPGGEQAHLGSRFDLSYTKRLPGGGRLTLGVGGAYRYQEDRFGEPESAALQETHTASTPFALPIALRNPLVVEASVVVTKVVVGPLPVGCVAPSGPPTPLAPGRDYTLRAVGDLTEIVPLPCAGAVPGINPGDTIAVDYRFRTAPDRTFTTASGRAHVGVDYGWIHVFASHDESQQDLVSGRDGRFLEDRRSDTAGLELRYHATRLTASVRAEARRLRSDRAGVSHDSLRGVQTVRLLLPRGLALDLSADGAIVEFPEQNRESRTVSVRARLSAPVAAGLFAELSGGFRRIDDTLFPTETTTEARLGIRWRFRQLEVNPSLEFFDRKRGDTETKEYRAVLRVVRHF